MATRAMAETATTFAENFSHIEHGSCVQASFDGGRRGEVGAGGWVIHRMSRQSSAKVLVAQGGQRYDSVISMDAELHGLELLFCALSYLLPLASTYFGA